MKLTTLTTLLTLTLPSLTSAWRLQLYRNAGYQVKILDESDLFSHDCEDLAAGLRDQTSSMHWDGEGLNEQCTVHLYERLSCSFPVVVKTEDTDIPNFATVGVNDEVSSWKVVCGETID